MHPRVENAFARRAAVVGTKVDDQRVVRDVPFPQLHEQLAEIGVHVLQHAEKLCRVFIHTGLAEIVLVILLRHDVRTVRGIERDVCKERLLRLALRIDPLQRLREEKVGAVARGLFERSVVPERGIDVRIVGSIAAGAGIGLSDAAAAVDIHFVETTTLRAIRRFVAEMPFAKNAGRVARSFEHLRQRERLQSHPLPLENRVRDSIFEFMPPAHQSRASRRASRAHVELREQQTLLLKRIHRRRAHDRIPKTRVIAVAHVVGHHEDDVGLG